MPEAVSRNNNKLEMMRSYSQFISICSTRQRLKAARLRTGYKCSVLSQFSGIIPKQVLIIL